MNTRLADAIAKTASSLMFLALSGCSIPFVTASAGSADLFPGTKDSFWAYDTTIDGKANFTMQMIANSAVAGDNAFKLYAVSWPGVTGGSNVKVTKDAVQIGTSETPLKLKLPLSEKDEPQFKDNGKDIKLKIVANESVSLANGNKFTAWRLDFNDTAQGSKTIQQWWIAPGVGLVKFANTDQKTTWELISYTIK